MYIKDNQEKQSIFVQINAIATVLFALWAITPFFLRNVSASVVFSIVALWIVSALLEICSKKKSTKNIGLIICIICWQLWEYCLRMVNFSIASWGNYYSRTLFWFSIIIFLFQSSYASINVKKRIARCIFIIYVVNLIDNMRLLMIYPTASADINFSWGVQYINMNVGTSMFVALTLIMFCISFSMAIKSKHTIGKAKLLWWLISGIELLYIFMSGRVTMLIFAVIAILFSIIAEKQFSQKQKILIYISGIIIVPIVLLFILPNLLEQIIRISQSDHLNERLKDLSNLLRGQADISPYDGSSFYTRINLYIISISTFFSSVKSFLIGVGYRIFESYYISLQTGVGGHSEFFDLLAEYGIIGFLFVFNIFRKAINTIINEIKKYTNHNNIKYVMLIYIFYSFFNNSFSPEIGVALFVLLPYSNYLIKQKEYKSID